MAIYAFVCAGFRCAPQLCTQSVTLHGKAMLHHVASSSSSGPGLSLQLAMGAFLFVELPLTKRPTSSAAPTFVSAKAILSSTLLSKPAGFLTF